MAQEIQPNHIVNAEGFPEGGTTVGPGVHVRWQKGPLINAETGERDAPNGCFVETVIAIAADRLAFYQDSPFACDENGVAIEHLNIARAVLRHRTERRTAAGVEGTWGIADGDRGLPDPPADDDVEDDDGAPVQE